MTEKHGDQTVALRKVVETEVLFHSDEVDSAKLLAETLKLSFRELGKFDGFYLIKLDLELLVALFGGKRSAQ